MRVAKPKRLTLQIQGLGLILYSSAAADHIREGSDYLSRSYNSVRAVQKHIQRGSIVGFGTGSPGTFSLRFALAAPKAREVDEAEFKLRLGLVVTGARFYVRDLYDLMDWSKERRNTPHVALEGGTYAVTVLSDRPKSGILGDRQQIRFFLERVATFPELADDWIPTLV